MPEKPNQGKPTLDQRRASHAWKVVCDVKRLPEEDARKFGIHVKKLPTRIMASGLGQGLAFLLAKKYAPQLLTALADWILDKRAHPDSQRSPPLEDALLRCIVQGNADFLRRATDEALAYIQWLGRFAEAEGLTQAETGD